MTNTVGEIRNRRDRSTIAARKLIAAIYDKTGLLMIGPQSRDSTETPPELKTTTTGRKLSQSAKCLHSKRNKQSKLLTEDLALKMPSASNSPETDRRQRSSQRKTSKIANLARAIEIDAEGRKKSGLKMVDMTGVASMVERFEREHAAQNMANRSNRRQFSLDPSTERTLYRDNDVQFNSRRSVLRLKSLQMKNVDAQGMMPDDITETNRSAFYSSKSVDGCFKSEEHDRTKHRISSDIQRRMNSISIDEGEPSLDESNYEEENVVEERVHESVSTEELENEERDSLSLLPNIDDGGDLQINQNKVKRAGTDGFLILGMPRPDRPVYRCESLDTASKNNTQPGYDKYISDNQSSPFGGNSRLRLSDIAAAATILSRPDDVSCKEGDDIALHTRFFGCPEPTVVWTKNGKPIEISDNNDQTGRVHTVSQNGESRLILLKLQSEDTGKYSVLVRNSGGSDEASASVRVSSTPHPPHDKPFVSAIDVERSSITISWYGSAYDGGSMLTGYNIEMSADRDSSDWTVVREHCISTSFIIDSLDVSKKYRFRVRAVNELGHSEPSQTSDLIGFADGIPGSSRRGLGAALKSEPSQSSENDSDGQSKMRVPAADRCQKASTFEAPFFHRIVTVEDGDKFKERHDIHEELGRGRFGVVFKTTRRPGVDGDSADNLYAAKFIRCRKADDKKKVRDEIEIMNNLEHPRLLQLASAYENPREMVMVMEYIGGGELFEKVVADDFTLTELDCIMFMRQICEAIGYMHSKHYVHLDLKPENILCKSKESHQIKIIDFGLTRRIEPDEEVRILFGTPEFVSPEVINYEPVGPPSDMWSVGVVCYVLISGLSPFMADTDPETFSNITRIQYDFDDEAFTAISNDAKQFISDLLVKDPRKRLSATDCFKHVWLDADNKEAKTFAQLNTEKLKSFLMRRKWQKAAHAIRALGRFTSLGFRAGAERGRGAYGGEVFRRYGAEPNSEGFSPVDLPPRAKTSTSSSTPTSGPSINAFSIDSAGF